MIVVYDRIYTFVLFHDILFNNNINNFVLGFVTYKQYYNNKLMTYDIINLIDSFLNYDKTTIVYVSVII